MTDTLTWIEKDTARIAPARARMPWATALVLALVPAALGLGLRRDFDGVTEPAVLLPNLALVGCALGFLGLRGYGRWAAFAVGLGISLHGARVLGDFTPEFWGGTESCILKGSFTGSVVALAFAALALAWAPAAGRAARFRVGVACALGGVAMLGFHCDSPSAAHLVLAHWGQGAFAIAIGAGLQGFLFRARVRAALGPRLSARLRGLSRL
jgi:hypothetical protein